MQIRRGLQEAMGFQHRKTQKSIPSVCFLAFILYFSFCTPRKTLDSSSQRSAGAKLGGNTFSYWRHCKSRNMRQNVLILQPFSLYMGIITETCRKTGYLSSSPTLGSKGLKIKVPENQNNEGNLSRR